MANYCDYEIRVKGNKKACLMAVSYTHLDVYKRQAEACNMPVGTFYGKARKFENVA